MALLKLAQSFVSRFPLEIFSLTRHDTRAASHLVRQRTGAPLRNYPLFDCLPVKRLTRHVPSESASQSVSLTDFAHQDVEVSTNRRRDWTSFLDWIFDRLGAVSSCEEPPVAINGANFVVVPA